METGYGGEWINTTIERIQISIRETRILHGNGLLDSISLIDLNNFGNMPFGFFVIKKFITKNNDFVPDDPEPGRRTI
jgi:hypothetical protein